MDQFKIGNGNFGPGSELPGLRSLYPDYTEEEIQQAYENLRRYFELGWTIFLRLRAEGKLDSALKKGRATF